MNTGAVQSRRSTHGLDPGDSYDLKSKTRTDLGSISYGWSVVSVQTVIRSVLPLREDSWLKVNNVGSYYSLRALRSHQQLTALECYQCRGLVNTYSQRHRLMTDLQRCYGRQLTQGHSLYQVILTLTTSSSIRETEAADGRREIYFLLRMGQKHRLRPFVIHLLRSSYEKLNLFLVGERSGVFLWEVLMCQNLEVIVRFVWNPEYDGWNSQITLWVA